MMMSSDANNPCGPIGALRLIHPPAACEPAPLRVESPTPRDRASDAANEDARARIGRENALAAALIDLRADDGRRIFALRVAEALEGGRAAILSPERRARLVRIASMLGVRTFDAHLVIAIVQDGARRGEIRTGTGHALALNADAAGATRRVRQRELARVIAQTGAALLLGAALFALLVGWVS